ncbi:hypothetical protein P3S67_011206 [Capsicum chacoense]
MADEIDQNQEIVALKHENRSLFVKMKELEAIFNEKLEVKGKTIEKLKQKLEERDGTVRFYSGVFEAMEREAESLKQKLKDVSQWKKKVDLLSTVKNRLAKIHIKELQSEVSELKNKLEIQGNKIPESVIDENEQVGGSPGVKAC